MATLLAQYEFTLKKLEYNPFYKEKLEGEIAFHPLQRRKNKHEQTTTINI